MQEKDRNCGDNAQRDEDEQRDPHANREAVGKRGLTGWDSHEPGEPFVEFHSMPSFRIRRTVCAEQGSEYAGRFPSPRFGPYDSRGSLPTLYSASTGPLSKFFTMARPFVAADRFTVGPFRFIPS